MQLTDVENVSINENMCQQTLWTKFYGRCEDHVREVSSSQNKTAQPNSTDSGQQRQEWTGTTTKSQE